MLEKDYMYSLSRQVKPLNAYLDVMVKHDMTSLTFSNANVIRASNHSKPNTAQALEEIRKVSKKHINASKSILESFEMEGLECDENLNSKHFRGIYNYKAVDGSIIEVFFIIMHLNRILYAYDIFFSFEQQGFFNEDFNVLPRLSVKKEELLS